MSRSLALEIDNATRRQDTHMYVYHIIKQNIIQLIRLLNC